MVTDDLVMVEVMIVMLVVSNLPPGLRILIHVFVAMKSSSSKIAIIVSPGAPRPLPQGLGPACEAK